MVLQELIPKKLWLYQGYSSPLVRLSNVHCAQGVFLKIQLLQPLINGEFIRSEKIFLDDPTAMLWIKALTFFCSFS